MSVNRWPGGTIDDATPRPSMASDYYRRHRRLAAVAASQPVGAKAWRHLERVADPCRLRLLLPPDLRSHPTLVSSTHFAWRFPDGSHLVLVVGDKIRGVEILDGRGVGRRLIRDTVTALEVALSFPELADFSALAESWLLANGALPALDIEVLHAALESPSRVVREAAIGALSDSVRRTRLG